MGTTDEKAGWGCDMVMEVRVRGAVRGPLVNPPAFQLRRYKEHDYRALSPPSCRRHKSFLTFGGSRQLISSTSKVRVALAGMMGGKPLLPYLKWRSQHDGCVFI